MASDNSPPRVRAIAITAFVALTILIGLKFVFDSYYLTMFEAEEYEKNGSVQSQDLLDLRAAEKRNLTTSSVPITQAMALLARGREAASAGMADGGITPEQSTDLNALIGWQKLPRTLTAAEKAEGSDAGATAAAAMAGGDGGAGAAMMTGDGGGTPALASDGGAAIPMSGGGLLDASAAPTNTGAHPANDAGASPHR
jgi:hypothetical protein